VLRQRRRVTTDSGVLCPSRGGGLHGPSASTVGTAWARAARLITSTPTRCTRSTRAAANSPGCPLTGEAPRSLSGHDAVATSPPTAKAQPTTASWPGSKVSKRTALSRSVVAGRPEPLAVS